MDFVCCCYNPKSPDNTGDKIFYNNYNNNIVNKLFE